MVRTELIYPRARHATRRASTLLNSGDSAAGLNEIRQAPPEIRQAQVGVPALDRDTPERWGPRANPRVAGLPGCRRIAWW